MKKKKKTKETIEGHEVKLILGELALAELRVLSYELNSKSLACTVRAGLKLLKYIHDKKKEGYTVILKKGNSIMELVRCE